MKEIYKVIKTIDGHTGKVIDKYNNIEDAREQLATELKYAVSDDYNYFDDTAMAEAEISLADSNREEWGEERVEEYIAALKKGIQSDAPFAANSMTGECITTKGDVFTYDNYKVEIVTEELTCEPFEAGTSYPVMTQDAQGNNKQVEYADGDTLGGLTYYDDFENMNEDFRESILANTEEYDHDAIEKGQVWVDDEQTIYAVLYSE